MDTWLHFTQNKMRKSSVVSIFVLSAGEERMVYASVADQCSNHVSCVNC